jgi:ATP-dependent helicase/nuclease subunit A
MTAGQPADRAERERAIHERAQNVIVDAGAGTGKTTLLVARLLHLIAPHDDGPAYALDRIAAITFTRKAAGELKLRLREKLLAELGKRDLSSTRRGRLTIGIELLDNALICTVHSFADRLLRLRPASAKLSPAYEIAEDADALIQETFAKLLALTAGAQEEATLQEVAETIRMFQLSGLLTRSLPHEWGAQLGLDAFVHDLIEKRDREVLDLAQPVEPQLEHVRRDVDELTRLLSDLTVDNAGVRRLRRLHEDAVWLTEATDAVEALRRAVSFWKELRKLESDVRKGEHFLDDDESWDVRRWLIEGVRGVKDTKELRSDGALGKAIVRPLFEYLSQRLVRMRNTVFALYQDVKNSHGVVDHVDLLIKLRDLLRDDLAARSFYQSKLDHIMVDEFQDTDPLQAEIVMYLCEVRASVRLAQDVELKPGKLTIVGDPKQSIYRFRRADITTYAMVCDKLRESEACEAQLRVNFRSAKAVLDWLNAGFDTVLGRESDGPMFDPEAGTVRNIRLIASGRDQPSAGVHILPFGAGKLKVDAARDLEGEALAHYIRYLVEDSDLQITDPRSHQLRSPRYGDIAVMMIATQTVHHLTSELDRIEVPHVVRGGTLFMDDPLHQQFILGLRALSDPGDGIARAALNRPPFFAVGLADLALERLTDTVSDALASTEAHIKRLRIERHLRPAGEVARHVLETTGFGRYVAAGVNGAQRLARLYELCLELDQLARTWHLDFDGTTAIARRWLDAPPRIEAPLPIDADAVQVITAHQAKGLEWPIVALWDGKASWRAFLAQAAFTVEAIGGKWAIKLHGMEYDPSNRDLSKRELKLLTAERKRVAYVAATRAREILIVPEAGAPSAQTIAGELILSSAKQPHKRVDTYKRERSQGAWWTVQTPVSSRPLSAARSDLDQAWEAAATKAAAPRYRPAAVSVIAHAVRDDVRETDEHELISVPFQPGRHGPIFGTAVHRALELILKRKLTPELATAQAVRENLIDDLRDLVLEDVARAHGALARAGLLQHALRVEYPVAGSLESETLVSGIIDLLVSTPDGLHIVDFKTDAAPTAEVARAYPAYVEQVRAYGKLLDHGAAMKVARTGLLFTANGGLHWV